MGLKDFFINRAIKSKMKKMSEKERASVQSVLDDDPDIFKKIDKEIAEKVKMGQNKDMAAMVVMKKYQKELKQQMMKENTKYKMK